MAKKGKKKKFSANRAAINKKRNAKITKKLGISKSDRYLRHRILRVGYSEDECTKILRQGTPENRKKAAAELLRKAPVDEDDTITTPDYDNPEELNDNEYDTLNEELKKVNRVLRKYFPLKGIMLHTVI